MDEASTFARLGVPSWKPGSHRFGADETPLSRKARKHAVRQK
jgi:hypothetical protein